MTATMQEVAAPSTVVIARDAHLEFSQQYYLEFSQQYSRGELEGMDSRELLDRYAE